MKKKFKGTGTDIIGAQMSPLFQQVKDYIILQIKTGDWTSETRIPSEHQIVEQFGVSRSTVNRALRELTAEGYLVRIQGVGTFVAPHTIQHTLLKIRSIADEIMHQGGEHSCDVHILREEEASPDLAFDMELAVGALVYRSLIVHKSNGKPVQLADRYINPIVAPEYLKQDFGRITPSEYLFQIGPLTEAEHTIEAMIPDENTRRYLRMSKNEPCLVIYRRTWTDGVVVSRASLYHPGSKFRPSGRFKPTSGTISDY